MANAVLFDLDGLLIDSEPHWRVAERQVLGALGVELADADLEATQGLRIDEVVRRYGAPRQWTAATQRAAVGDILDAVEHQIRHHAKAMPGVAHIMALTDGRPRAIASSSPSRLIEAAAEALDLPVALRVSAESVPQGKPAPDVYLRAASLLGVAPVHCTALEDSVHGVAAACSAGMRCIAVPSQPSTPGFRDAAVIRQSLFAVLAADLDG